MLRKLLERRVGNLTKEEFAVICEIVEDDIRFNRIYFKKCTNLKYLLDVAVRFATVFRKCA